jgi:hypothetical protein
MMTFLEFEVLYLVVLATIGVILKAIQMGQIFSKK